jgi:hypothetical protein
MKYLLSNLNFYLGTGYGSSDNWLIFNLILGCLGWYLCFSKSSQTEKRWNRVQFAAAIVWGVPTLYFLTHQVQVGYYQVPSIWATALILATGALESESKLKSLRFRGDYLFFGLGSVLAVLPGILAIKAVQNFWLAQNDWRGYQISKLPVLQLPEEVQKVPGWIWADQLSGTIRYYENQAAFKLPFSEPKLRKAIYQNLVLTGDPQYFIEDSPSMTLLKEEAEGWGIQMTQIGTFADKGVYRMAVLSSQ